MKPIYLEPDEEITSVIDKITALSDRRIVIVVPKNSTLFQSLINLKLLAKEAKEHDKVIAIVSSNRVGQRLAQQVGFQTYNSLGSLGPEKATEPTPASQAAPAKEPEEEVVNGVRVNQYNPAVPTAHEESIEEAVATAPIVAEDALPTAPVEVVSEEDAPSAEPGPAEKAETEATEAGDKPKETTKPTEPVAEPKGELPPIVSRTITMSAPKEPIHIPWRAILAVGALLLIALVVLFLFLPRADVVLTFPATPVNQTVPVVAATATNQSGTIAGNLLTVSESDKKTFAATGKKDIGTKAKGTITITNKYKDASGAGKDESFAAGTVATDTATKLTFTLDNAVTVGKVTYNTSNGQPIYQSQNVNVTAVDPGDASNLKPSTFTIAGALDGTTVASSTAFSGGQSKQVTVLTQSDIDTATAALKQSLSDKATADLKSKADQQTTLDNSAWQEIKDQTLDHKVNDQTDTATLSLALNESIIAFDKTAAENNVKAAVSKDIPTGQELIVPADKPIVFTYQSISDDKTAMTFNGAIQAFIVQRIDKTEIAKAVAHRSKSHAEAILKDQFKATDVKITLTPSWWFGGLPMLSQAIKVDHGFNESTGSDATVTQ